MRTSTDLNLSSPATTRWVALVGAPNCGKTTLYNWLTNSKFKTVNYPGATVEYSIGQLAARYSASEQDLFSVMDTPGTYSLFPKSLDEEVTLKALYEHPQFANNPHVVLVVDGTQMSRHLLIAQQMKEAGFHFVIALTMADLLRKENVQLNTAEIEKQFSCKVILIDGVLGSGINDLVAEIKNMPTYADSVKTLKAWSDSEITQKIQTIEACVQRTLTATDQKISAQQKLAKIYESTAKADKVLLHPVFGFALFVLIMWALFSLIYWGASPLMDLVDKGFSTLNNQVSANVSGLLGDFLANGVVSSFGAVLVFVPQIFILFFGIGVLESSGYLARAATLIDRPFSKLGLSGRSFVPILSGFACAVPAIMATRNIASKRDRWITNFIIPLMSCSARLPVYALLLGFLFLDQPAWKAGFALAMLYIGSLIVGSLAAAVVNKILIKNDVSLFMMELPMYRKPQWKVLIKQSLTRTQNYVKRAGPVIFVFAILIWVGTTFPNATADNHQKLETSYLGQVGQVIEPVFKPMGVDWRVGVGLISAFAAREVFVSSLAVMFNIDGEEEAQREGLIKAMGEAKMSSNSGEQVQIFTVASVIGLLLFFMIALQCMSTFAIQVKENGSWHLAVLQLVVFNIAAYVIAVSTVQGLRFLGVQ